MKVWTVQSKAVIDEIFRIGLYLPDFKKSKYLAENPKLDDLYKWMLDSFNANNSCKFSGLIFAFMSYSDNGISELQNFAEFKNLITNRKCAIDSLWKNYLNGNYAILELEYRENFNVIPIDINDFQFLMPPIMILEPYRDEHVQLFVENISKGVMVLSPLYSEIVQVHFPYIKRENVIDIHPMFEI